MGRSNTGADVLAPLVHLYIVNTSIARNQTT